MLHHQYNVESQETKIFTLGETWKVSFTKKTNKMENLKIRRGKRKYLLSSWTFSRHAEITTCDMSLTANSATLCKIRLRKYQRNISSLRKFQLPCTLLAKVFENLYEIFHNCMQNKKKLLSSIILTKPSLILSHTISIRHGTIRHM